MFVSVEMMTVIGCAVSIIVAFVSACGWFLTRMDARFGALDASMGTRFAAQDARMEAGFAAQDATMDARFAAQDAAMEARFAAQDARMEARFAAQDTRFDRLEDRLSGVEHELSEVKVAVARLEGPRTRLLTSR
ncbi:hypothetical protein [Microbacterium sp. H83]|uniref:hypothetical protein n=1 Tax=Microbacterium sp. H83 TaxID=1827324 RepID=UPI0007F337C3|nr:hypothetical protein [Microbacterium sp. H83]OAN34025.1 hypothetical protein A4X16_06160 [Microbacterium sp. H83]